MTAPRLDGDCLAERAIRDALSAGPTPGPWIADNNEGFGIWSIWSRMTPSGSGTPGPRLAQVIGDSAQTDADAALIAACNPEAMQTLLAELDRLRAALSASKQGGKAEETVLDLLWNDYPECCGNPEVGAEYMGQREMICCGCPEPALLNDKQIVAALRAQFPAPAAQPQGDSNE
jgi:hypothetical protein